MKIYKYKYKLRMNKVILIILGIFFAEIAIGQSLDMKLISSSGDSFNNSSYQLDWSIGECVTATFVSPDFLITQGFHQNSYQIMSIEDLCVDIKIKVYPNPTTNFVTLKVENSKTGNMQYTLTSVYGKTLEMKEITKNQERINFSDFTIGTYFISISENNKLIKTFKIIKK